MLNVASVLIFLQSLHIHPHYSAVAFLFTVYKHLAWQNNDRISGLTVILNSNKQYPSAINIVTMSLGLTIFSCYLFDIFLFSNTLVYYIGAY